MSTSTTQHYKQYSYKEVTRTYVYICYTYALLCFYGARQ